ncbi:energy-coupling factor ABC transporter ATP-binding protein [bacterium]|nr:energy-coupling factor ABC transporter ATP-binding protein [bacterium]
MSSSAISVRSLSVNYPDGRKGIEDISFEIEQGESVAILGANGAGKSTLLLALVGVLGGTGEIEIAGMPVNSKSLSKVRAKAQLVFQDPNDQLFSPILADDIAFGPRNFGAHGDEIDGIVSRSLEAVGLKGFEERQTHSMSLGEKKRAAIASAIACKPEILLMDEPSAGLDPRGARLLAKLLDALDCTKLISTHDLRFAKTVCTRAIVMSEGTIAAIGSTQDILSDASLLSACGLK